MDRFETSPSARWHSLLLLTCVWSATSFADIIVFVAPEPISVSSTGSVTSVDVFDITSEIRSLDLNMDGISDLTVSAAGGVYLRGDNANRYLTRIGGMPEPLSEGVHVGETAGTGPLIWSNPGSYEPLILFYDNFGTLSTLGAFRGKRGYLGVEFFADGAAHYGWVDMYVAPDRPFAEIYAWAYESESATGIVAGAIPEPTTAILFCIGGLSMYWIRSKR